MRKKRRKQLYRILFFVLMCIGVGYAALTTDLSINGVANVTHSSWDIHFDNLVVNQNSTATVNQAATIDSDTAVSYEITMSQPGEFYEFNVDVVNGGTIDGMIESITSKMNNTLITTLPNYLEYSITYNDGVALAPNQLLEAGNSETYKVRIGYKKDINPEDLPSTDETLSLLFTVTYVQADEDAIPVPHPNFAIDSWETILGYVQSGNPIPYHVGDTREIELGNSLGTHTLRIANMSTPSECATTGFSQTACGFVIEFADIINTHNMNPSDSYYQGITYFITGWNIDGWPDSSMRAYLNDTNVTTSIINYLPVVLKNAIINTTVISGHGSTAGETNFTSTDKLYLLSSHEVWEDDDENTNTGINYRDTAYNNTRQLDYYSGLNVTTSNYSGASKQKNGSDYCWWLRYANAQGNTDFGSVNDNGSWNVYDAGTGCGVSPAFRIG